MQKLKTQGYTVFEIMASSTIFAFVTVSIFSMFLSSNKLFVAGVEKSTNQNLSNVTLAKMQSMLNQGLVFSCTSEEVVFQIPGDWDNDGDFLKSDMSLDLGAHGNAGWFMSYKFEPSGQSVRENNRFDFNKDGDRTDIFNTGHIAMIVKDENDQEMFKNIVSTENIFRNPAEPIFRRVKFNKSGVNMVMSDDTEGQNIKISLWVHFADRQQGLEFSLNVGSTVMLSPINLQD